MNGIQTMSKKVIIGKSPVVEDYVILGKCSGNASSIKEILTIGNHPILRSGTIIYEGTVIKDNFQTGDNARIRENNVIGDHVSIGTNTVIENDCYIGDKVRIHSNCFICEYTRIEENAWIGPGVILTNVLHPPCPVFKKNAPVHNTKCCIGPTIKKNAVIGAGAIILPGIIIGNNALVGAGAVVTKDVPAGSVVVGNPARIIKNVSGLGCILGFYKEEGVYSWREQ